MTDPEPLIQRIDVKFDARGLARAKQAIRAYSDSSRRRFDVVGEASAHAAGTILDSNGRVIRSGKKVADKSEKDSDRTRRSWTGAFTKIRKQARSFIFAFNEADSAMGKLAVTGVYARKVLGSLAVGVTAIVAIGFAAVLGGIAIALGFGAAKAIRFQEALVQVQKTTGLTDSALAGLSDRLLSLSARLGMARDAVAGIAEIAGQLGIQGVRNIAAFTETVAKLSAVSDLMPEAAANAIARISQTFDLAIQKSAALGSVLNELSNTTTATAGDLVDAMTRVGPSAANLGVSVQAIAALAATLIDSGIAARRSGTYLRNIFNLLSVKGAEIADQMGITEEAFRDMISDDALAALQAYLDHLNTLDNQIATVQAEEIFGRRTLVAIQALADGTEEITENLNVSNEALAEATSLQVEFRRSLQSVAAQWRKFSKTVGRFLTQAGALLLPFLEGTLRLLNNLKRSNEEVVASFQELSAEQEALAKDRAAIETYKDLSDNLTLTVEQAVALRDAIDRLAQRYPGYISQTNALGEATGFYADTLERAVQLREALNRAERGAALEELLDRFGAARRRQATLETQQQDIADAGFIVQRPIRGTGTINILQDQQVDRALESLQMDIDEATKSARTLGGAIRAVFTDEQGRFDAELMTQTLHLMGLSMDEAEQQTREFARAMEVLGKTQQQFNPEWLDMMTSAVSEAFGSGGDGGLNVDPDTQAKLEGAADAIERMAEELRIAAARGPELENMLRRLAEVQRQIEAQREALATVGPDSALAQQARENIGALEQEAAAVRDNIREFKDLRTAVMDAVQAMGELATAAPQAFDVDVNVPQSLDRITSTMRFFNREIQRVNLAFQTGTITAEQYGERVEAAQKRATEALKEYYRWLVKTNQLTPELEKRLAGALENAGKSTEDITSGSEKLAGTLGDVAGAVDGVARLADAFGDVDSETRQALDAVSSLIQGVAQLVSSKGTSITGWVQAISGAVALGATVFGGNDEEVRQLGEELRDNVDAVRDNTRALREQAQVGTDVSREQLRQAQDILNRLEQGGPRSELLGRLEATGIEQFQGLQDLYVSLRDFLNEAVGEPGAFTAFTGSEAGAAALNVLLGRAQVGENPEMTRRILGALADSEFANLPNIQAVLSNLETGLGDFGESVAGARAETEFFARFMDETATDSLHRFVQSLLTNVSDIGPALRERLEEIQGLDLSTAEGRKRLNAIIATLAANRDQLRGDLTPSEFTDLLEQLNRLQQSGGPGAGGAPTARSVVRDVGITEFQANTLLAYQREQVYRLGQIFRALTGKPITATPTGPTPTLPTAPGPIIEDVQQVSRDITDAVTRPILLPAGDLQSIADSLRSATNGKREPIEIRVYAEETPESISQKLDRALRSPRLY